MKSANKWLISVVAIVLSIMIFLSAVVYIVDPAFQFRVHDDTYLLSSRYVSAGLIKNHNYDTILFGSSMVQNFDVQYFEEQLGGSMLKIGVSSMNAVEMSEFLNLAYKTNKANRYFLCIDISSFREYGKSKNYQFLLKDDFLSFLRYCVDYNTWLRYLPLDVCLYALKIIDKVPANFETKLNIDFMEDWSADHTCSKDNVIKKYLNDTDGVSKVNLENLEENLKNTINKFFESVDSKKGEHIFFFPPYSSLFWCGAQDDGYFETYITAKEYFYKVANEHGCSVIDFQSADFTDDLDNYRDLTHYGKHINSWMSENFNNSLFMVNDDNLKYFGESLRIKTEEFRNNTELFND